MVSGSLWDKAYIGRRYDATEDKNKHYSGSEYKIYYYGSLIKKQSGSSDLYQSEYEIRELIGQPKSWILPPPAS